MPASISYPETLSSTPNSNESHGASRLRTVTGNRFPRKCACKCGNTIRETLRSCTLWTSAPPGPTPPTSASTRPITPVSTAPAYWPVSAPLTPTANPPSPRDLIASLRTVQVPGTPATYANRAYLRDLGLRWDPANRRWHGTTTTDRVRELRERLGLEVRVFGDLAAPPKGPAAPKLAIPRPVVVTTAVPDCDGTRRVHDGSRTRAEARIAIPSLEEPEEIPTSTRRFSLLETTSGLPDDSREADEREAERRLRDLRGRVKRARAVVENTPGLAESLAEDWRKAARFYAKFGVTEERFRNGVPDSSPFPGLLNGYDSISD